MNEAKGAYELALSFFEKNQPKKKKKSTQKPKIKATKKTTTPKDKSSKKEKPASNAKVTTLSELQPTPSKVAKKLPKPLRIKKVKSETKKPISPPKIAVKKVASTPKPAPKTPAKPVTEVTQKPTPKKPTITQKQMEDLKVVEGVGPAIERLLKSKGIKTLEDLSVAKIAVLRNILEEAGSRFRFHKPDTWARQARLAAKGRWKELDVLQKQLDGGKKK